MESTFQNTWLPLNVSNERLCGVLLALAVHGALVAAGSFGLMQRADFGMDASNGMAEVDLIAAPAPMAVPAVTRNTTPQEPPRAIPTLDKEDIATPDMSKTIPVSPTVTPVANALLRTNDLSGPLGDGSSPVPGTDATTLHHAGSSGAFFRPGYYRNPPPPYPPEARKLKQQGRVLLEVHVTADGKVSSLRLEQSSGFPLLDQAALQSVKGWRFRPASVGGLRIETVAQVPIRFQLQ